MQVRFKLDRPGPRWQPEYNAPPTAQLPIVFTESPPQVRLMRWGLVPFFAKEFRTDYATFNARVETVETSPVFRKAFKHGRCILPINHFYEWHKVGAGKNMVRTPYLIKHKTDDWMGIAAIYDIWKDAEDMAHYSFSVITTTANELMSKIHSRQPCILRQEDEEKWMDNSWYEIKALKKFLSPFPADEMAMWKIADRVNNPRNDDKNLMRKEQ